MILFSYSLLLLENEDSSENSWKFLANLREFKVFQNNIDAYNSIDWNLKIVIEHSLVRSTLFSYFLYYPLPLNWGFVYWKFFAKIISSKESKFFDRCCYIILEFFMAIFKFQSIELSRDIVTSALFSYSFLTCSFENEDSKISRN